MPDRALEPLLPGARMLRLGEYEAARTFFGARLAHLSAAETPWPYASVGLIKASLEVGDDAAISEAFSGLAAALEAASEFRIEPAQAAPWLVVGWYLLVAAHPGRDAVVRALAPTALAFAAAGRRHLTVATAGALDLLAAALLRRGQIEDAATIDSRLRRTHRARARALHLDLAGVRRRWDAYHGGGGNDDGRGVEEKE